MSVEWLPSRLRRCRFNLIAATISFLLEMPAASLFCASVTSLPRGGEASPSTLALGLPERRYPACRVRSLLLWRLFLFPVVWCKSRALCGADSACFLSLSSGCCEAVLGAPSLSRHHATSQRLHRDRDLPEASWPSVGFKVGFILWLLVKAFPFLARRIDSRHFSINIFSYSVILLKRFGAREFFYTIVFLSAASPFLPVSVIRTVPRLTGRRRDLAHRVNFAAYFPEVRLVWVFFAADYFPGYR